MEIKMTKLYVPYDYRTISKGFYEIEVDSRLVDNAISDIKDGTFDVKGKGTQLPGEVVFEYDHHVLHRDVMSESKYLNELEFKDTDKGFTVNGGTRD
jgi:hypothetical protein